MAAPSSYTESSLADFMISALGEVADTLGWATLADVQEAANDALVLYGASDAASASNIPKLRALARVAAWRMAVASLAARFDFTTDQQSFRRSQMLEGAQKALAQVEADAMVYGLSGYSVELQNVRFVHDPYDAKLTDEDRVLTP